MVGRVIATDLASEPDWSVLAVDHRPEALALLTDRAARLGVRVETRQADLADPRVITELLTSSRADVVSGAMASQIAHRAMAAVIDAGLPYCDISFMPEDFTDLSAYAVKKGVTVVADCGVAPGMSHILAARSALMLDTCDELTILVGGLPLTRTWPFDY
jgi:saccharopine dehydrogenase-like NADP-dependent oxidoreductase